MFLFISLMITAVLSGTEVDIFTPSFPNLQEHFGLSPFMVQLTLSVNFIGYCFSSLIVGPLGDRFGRRPIILYCLVIFIAGSILCLFSPAYWVLVLGRFLQGLGISGPTVLSYVVLMDQYPPEKQPAMMGLLNGVVAFSMGFAPVIGSFVNLYYGWHGNFSILLILSLISFTLCCLTLPKGTYNKNVSLSLASYIPLLKSKAVIQYTWALCLVVVGYWVFIGISPILYMEDMGVELKHFGYYQGIMAGAFAVVSVTSPILLKKFGNHICLKVGSIASAAGALCLLIVGFFVKDNPVLLTFLMVIYTAGLVFPVNILFPSSLVAYPGSQSKISALLMAGRLIINAAALQFLGYIYNGYFYPLGIFIGFVTVAGFFVIRTLPDWRKASFVTETEKA
jgi:DHA1 family bicyclomycin/chloramphenicol resistance-like MFS transporter